VVDRQRVHANIVFDGDTRPRMYINGPCVRVRAWVRACVAAYPRIGAATETKFDCREAKGLFYTLQTNCMREINDSA